MNEHDSTQRLIPWYANGSLDEPDMALVDRHLPGCGECRETLAEAMRHTRALNAASGEIVVDTGARDENFQQLRKRLASGGNPGSASTRLHASGRWPGVAAVAAGVLLAVGVSLAWWVSPRATVAPGDESRYQAMTADSSIDAQVLQVIFHGDTSERDIRLLLLESGGELLGTPSPKGVYRIALPDPAGVEDYVERLRQHPAIRWAELER